MFGVVYQEAHGHVVTAVLIAMIAMLFTAISYGRMARAYPSVGSAYTYVSREVHPAGRLGRLEHADGLCAQSGYLHDLVQQGGVEYSSASALRGLDAAVCRRLHTLNLRGIQATARTNILLTVGMGSVVAITLAAFWRYAANLQSVDWIRPFYDPSTYSPAALSSGAALAVLTYIGFDAISTLSEETRDPRRNILLGTVYTWW
ncbi:MAG: hypothetical protein WKF37_04090 [Bryobacteraceae bacterium]